MKEKTAIMYDEVGDILEVRVGKPSQAYFEDLGNDIFERKEERTGKTKGFVILNFKKRVDKKESVMLPER